LKGVRIGKNYKLSSKSDMNRFMKDLKKQIYSDAEREVLSRTYDVECPDCHSQISIKPGKSICPICHNEIDFKLDIKYEK